MKFKNWARTSELYVWPPVCLTPSGLENTEGNLLVGLCKSISLFEGMDIPLPLKKMGGRSLDSCVVDDYHPVLKLPFIRKAVEKIVAWHLEEWRLIQLQVPSN